MKAIMNDIDFKAITSNDTSIRLYTILQKWIPFVDDQFANWDHRPNCGHFFGGSYFYSVETAIPMFIYSIISTNGNYDENITGISKKSMKEKAVKALRYLCFTHDLGPKDCVREKSDNIYASETKWGGKDDLFFRASGMGRTTTFVAICTLLLKDYLDEETIEYSQKIVEYYCDRWSSELPRVGTYFDTQSEENAWTSIGISAGLILFKEHPRREIWLDAYIKWSLNSVVTFKDRMNTSSHLGKSFRNYWMQGVTFHPDFTNENHSFVHPSYVTAAIILRAESVILFKLTGNEIFDCAFFNNENIYHESAKKWLLSDGLLAPIQGQDWWYTRYHERHLFHGVMSLFHQEEYSTYYENISIEYMEKLQDSHKYGCLLEDNHEQKIDEHGHYSLKHMEFGCVMSIGYSYLLHALFGENNTDITEERISSELAGVYDFPHGGSIIHRTKDNFTSFSYRNKVMALNLPKEGLWSITPIVSSMTGVIEFYECDMPYSLSNQFEIRDCNRYNITKSEQGFGITCKVIRGNEKIHQYISFVSLPNGVTIYTDQFYINKDCQVKQFYSGLIGIRNEFIDKLPDVAKGYRNVYTGNHQYKFNGYFGGEHDDIIPITHDGYINIDQSIGYLIYGSHDVTYINKHHYTSWRGVEDQLLLNHIKRKSFTTGESIAPFTMIALANCNNEETALFYLNTIKYKVSTENVTLYEINDYLVFNNFSDQLIMLNGSTKKNSTINIFNGETIITNQLVKRILQVLPFSSDYLESFCKLTTLDKCQLHIIAINKKIIITNNDYLSTTIIFLNQSYSIESNQSITIKV